MNSSLRYENYPWPTVFLANMLNLGIYFVGAFLFAQIQVWLMIPFLLYALFLEIRLLKTGCTQCYYYGKVCAFGKGVLSSLLFKKGDSALFSQRCLTWKDMIPDLLLTLIPLGAGIYILITDFRWIVLILMLFLLAFSTFGNSYIRGSRACAFCKQKDLGCPADVLFNPKETQ